LILCFKYAFDFSSSWFFSHPFLDTAAASPRLVTPSLARMFETCTLTVLAEMKN